MKVAVLFAVFLSIGSPSVQAQETPHIVFVGEFIRELAANEDARAAGERETKANGGNPFEAGISSSKRINDTLHAQTEILQGMRLNHPFENLIPDITSFYEAKIGFHEELIDIFKALAGGPQQGVDYSDLAAMAPNILDFLQRIDRSLLKATPTVFSTLIDPTPDFAGKIEHLTITRAQRDQLLQQLTTGFGDKLNQKDPSYTVMSAIVLRNFLTREYKYADQPL